VKVQIRADYGRGQRIRGPNANPVIAQAILDSVEGIEEFLKVNDLTYDRDKIESLFQMDVICFFKAVEG
jgi:hypothetical protein